MQPSLAVLHGGDWEACRLLCFPLSPLITSLSSISHRPLQELAATQPSSFLSTPKPHLLPPQLVSVLLLALKQGEEAVAQLERHLRLLRRPALPDNLMPPGLLGSHHGWVCR